MPVDWNNMLEATAFYSQGPGSCLQCRWLSPTDNCSQEERGALPVPQEQQWDKWLGVEGLPLQNIRCKEDAGSSKDKYATYPFLRLYPAEMNRAEQMLLRRHSYVSSDKNCSLAQRPFAGVLLFFTNSITVIIEEHASAGACQSWTWSVLYSGSEKMRWINQSHPTGCSESLI